MQMQEQLVYDLQICSHVSTSASVVTVVGKCALFSIDSTLGI